MLNKKDLIKEIEMVWSKATDIVVRSNIIKKYIEEMLKDSGIDSSEFILMIVDFDNNKIENYDETTVIKINHLNMSGELSPLLACIDDVVREIRVGNKKKLYKIDELSKEIKRN